MFEHVDQQNYREYVLQIVKETLTRYKPNLFDAMMERIEEKVGFSIYPAKNDAFFQVTGKTLDELQMMCTIKNMDNPNAEEELEENIKLWNT
mmetsp:Transcript_8233/g.12610  ORF Transcript_8233/g.12610 Transcript_8233/m.12610 type:complete len:92 (-) Transcript_8233:267-542(-)